MVSYHDRVFAFDVGSNSIGWCVLSVNQQREPQHIIDMGVRIFSDGREPKSKQSLAVARREARSASRRRDRYKRRRKATLAALVECGMMPDEPAAIKALLLATGDHPASSVEKKTDPYSLRARALNEKLPLAYVGRAIFHLGQRRGFKSNRKTDRKTNEKGKIAVGVEQLHGLINAAKMPTLGAYLAKRRDEGHVVRIRSGSEAFNESDYAFYPERSMLEAEFSQIWDAQAAYYPAEMTPARKEHLFKIIFYQRPLKEPVVGRCAFNPKETRIEKAHPLFQEFRLYKEVNELGIVGADMRVRKLTKDERDLAVTLLRPKKTLTFKKLGKELKLRADERFNKDTENRKEMKGDEIYAAFIDKKAFGVAWGNFDAAQQWDIVKTLRDEADPDTIEAWLRKQYGLDGDELAHVMNLHLPEGHGRLGQKALSEMLEELKREVITEAEAAKRCGYDHALAREGEGLDQLPPYQEVLERNIPPGTGNIDDPYDIEKGRITNPTVHISLNQLRRVVNALLKRYGKPIEMAIELARDLGLSELQRAEVNRKIADNTKAAKARSKILEDMKVPDNGYNRQLIKLWQELHEKPEARVCVYSGEPISAQMFFSGAVDIDHILPWSRTLDDSQSNKLLCLKQANRQKGNHAPAEVTQWQDKYDEILARATALPKNKQWRFAKDAMQKFEEKGGFLARQLTDTQYLSRLAFAYLNALYPSEEADEHGELKRRPHVRVVPGQLTEMLRRNWGLNQLLPDHNHVNVNQPKNRQDHRHHAIDAFVVGLTNRSLLQKVSTLSGQKEKEDVENFIKDSLSSIEPWAGFRQELAQALARIVVSHKQDHGTIPHFGDEKDKGKTAAKLHNDTAYGLTGETDDKGTPFVVRRKAFLSLEPKDIASIRDSDLQAELYSALSGLEGKDYQLGLLDFARHHKRFKGIRRVRIVEKLNVIPIRDKNGKIYKAFKGDANYRYDVWQLLDGKWVVEIVTMFDAHQPGWKSKIHAEHPTAKKVLSLQQNDMVAYEHPDDGYTIARVVKFSQNGQIFFASHQESNVDQRNRDKDDPFKTFSKMPSGLKEIHCRQIRVDEIGKVFDLARL